MSSSIAFDSVDDASTRLVPTSHSIAPGKGAPSPWIVSPPSTQRASAVHQRLPNAHSADVPEAKLREYLLSEEHPHGWPKALFFLKAGYGPDRIEDLRVQLRLIARNGTVAKAETTRWGSKFVVDGYIEGVGRSLLVRTVWIVETGVRNPRLVTAYPAPLPGEGT